MLFPCSASLISAVFCTLALPFGMMEELLGVKFGSVVKPVFEFWHMHDRGVEAAGALFLVTLPLVILAFLVKLLPLWFVAVLSPLVLADAPRRRIFLIVSKREKCDVLLSLGPACLTFPLVLADVLVPLG
jgi:hypothetical protein